MYLLETLVMPKQPIPEYQEKRIEEIRLFIKNYRINDGLTQSEFSKIADVHVNSIQRFERGNDAILIEQAQR